MIFLNSASSAAALVFYLPGGCTHWHRGKTEKDQSPEVYKIFRKKTQYLMNTLYIILCVMFLGGVVGVCGLGYRLLALWQHNKSFVMFKNFFINALEFCSPPFVPQLPLCTPKRNPLAPLIQPGMRPSAHLQLLKLPKIGCKQFPWLGYMFVRKEGDMAIPTGLYRGKLHRNVVDNELWSMFVHIWFYIQPALLK